MSYNFDRDFDIDIDIDSIDIDIDDKVACKLNVSRNIDYEKTAAWGHFGIGMPWDK